MDYANELLRAAVKVAGSRYKLAAITTLKESHLSEVWHGRRKVPKSWILELAVVAGVNPAEAMERYQQCRKDNATG